MSFDFTLNKYGELCRAIVESRYTVSTVAAYVSAQVAKEECLILRHDVDRKPVNALRMAELENRHGLKSTYYFRVNNSVFAPDLITEVAARGHEVGYHYEALDRARLTSKDKSSPAYEEE